MDLALYFSAYIVVFKDTATEVSSPFTCRHRHSGISQEQIKEIKNELTEQGSFYRCCYSNYPNTFAGRWPC